MKLIFYRRKKQKKIKKEKECYLTYTFKHLFNVHSEN